MVKEIELMLSYSLEGGQFAMVKVTQKDDFQFMGSGAEYPGELLIDAHAHVGEKG
jgi:hypothetical protein